ncbi:unnamed protein product [Pedinophyceae sp. YPF-701]|nr:unnamed protein product [Pedinophyceae sp. YPF-701]
MTEKFLKDMQSEMDEDSPVTSADLEDQMESLRSEAQTLTQQIDGLFADFLGVTLPDDDEDAPGEVFQGLTEPAFVQLSRERPRVSAALLRAAEAERKADWPSFQRRTTELKQRRSRVERELESLRAVVADAKRAAASRAAAELRRAESDARDDAAGGATTTGTLPGGQKVRVVLLSGFESFNVGQYRDVARQLARRVPGAELCVFSDRDLDARRGEVEAALDGADVLFASLLFDFDQVEWLRARAEKIPTRLVFESALELMSLNQVGSFKMGGQTGEKKGPPPAVKKVLSLFGSQREEDKMVGYLSFLKVGPKLLKYVPGDKAKDLRAWLTAYSYWNQGGAENVLSMLLYLLADLFGMQGAEPAPVQETPPLGLLHPDAGKGRYFSSPERYLEWYRREGPLRGQDVPTVAVLLYRKHVITEQPYIDQMIRAMEASGVRPLPIFINGVEAHTIVRDMLTSEHERKAGVRNPTLRQDAVDVDAVVNTIGFPLVGGPAGSVEAGRQSDVAKAILEAKNIPYVVAAPLLIQDMSSWVRDGVAGLQSVVLYSLPELDGAIDTVPLGGLVGDDIYLVPERVMRLSERLRRWTALKKKPASKRKAAIVLYGFPPGVGATGTAALLNVPKSLEAVLERMEKEGYDVGRNPGESFEGVGERLVKALGAQLADQRRISQGAEAVDKLGAAGAESYGFRPATASVTPRDLKAMLTFPRSWGPSEWGPIPYLPDPDILVSRMENQWGSLDTYRGIMTSARGDCICPGVQAGNVWIGVQPALGLEGDPMRLLFERDLTPHPQYAAFYKWLQEGYDADVVLHFGMHGTVEWLPGSPLGNTGLSWSDVLLGHIPNVYIYACNNPSESIIAKRRGYGTIVSHNVPPYGRAGLYKQLAELKALLQEYREDPENNEALRAPIAQQLNASGLEDDCPYRPSAASGLASDFRLTPESAGEVPAGEFGEYAGELYAYLQVVESRLYSEGLHVLGSAPGSTELEQYLTAYFGDSLSADLVDEVVRARSVEAARVALERAFAQPDADVDDGVQEKVKEALEIRRLLELNSEELSSVSRALRGEFVPPAAGGDLLRDGAGVLPTGRNIHALDPYRMPSDAAEARGAAVGAEIIRLHREQNGGAYPETCAVNLWGLDAIKTKGESVGILLHLVGARVVKDQTGRVVRFEPVPLDELGRPRVDVLCNMSGIFRDSFQNVVELLDDLFQRLAALEEPEDMNFVKKHAASMSAKGLENPTARLFSNPAGDYGSMVNERVGASDWTGGDELGDTWASRNAFSYGRGSERGTARPEVLESLLATTDRVVQEIDSVEYGLTDIQEYYANTGGVKRAAEVARKGKKVGCSVVESFGRDVTPRELDEVLRLEYRSKLLNPKWADAMVSQGSGGAYEVSQRMTALMGWGATVDFQENWVWDQAAETYALDEEMAARLRKSNPEAFRNIVKRMLEASGRGMWDADDGTLERLQELYQEMDDQLEGVIAAP